MTNTPNTVRYIYCNVLLETRGNASHEVSILSGVLKKVYIYVYSKHIRGVIFSLATSTTV